MPTLLAMAWLRTFSFRMAEIFVSRSDTDSDDEYSPAEAQLPEIAVVSAVHGRR